MAFPAQPAVLSELPFSSGEKIIQTFRLPRELVAFLKSDATRRSLDLTAYVTRLLDGFRTYFGLPAAATALLEADREALKLERYEYVLHVFFQRNLEIREKGPGFDGPRGDAAVPPAPDRKKS